MKYHAEMRGSVLVPKLVGSYEEELHHVVGQIARNGYRTIVDIGCAEGYYAVGLAMLVPTATVIGYDIDERAQRICRRIAEINGVARRVTVLGECSHGELRSRITDRTLIVCDCEGFEHELLRCDIVPELHRCDLLVELHGRRAEIDSFVGAFSRTHNVELIQSRERRASDYPAVLKLETTYCAPRNEAAPSVLGLDHSRRSKMRSWRRKCSRYDSSNAVFQKNRRAILASLWFPKSMLALRKTPAESHEWESGLR